MCVADDAKNAASKAGDAAKDTAKVSPCVLVVPISAHFHSIRTVIISFR